MTLRSRRTAAQQAVIAAAIDWAQADAALAADDYPEMSDEEVAARGEAYLQAGERLSDEVAVLVQIEMETPGRVRAPWPAPSTSQEAADYMAQYVEKPLGIIWLLLQRAHRGGAVGLTCDQVETMTKIGHGTASARFNQLRDTGWIIDSGLKRKTRAGRDAVVWKPTTFGLESAEKVKGWGWTGEPA